MLEGQHGEYGFHGSGRAQEVAGLRFGGADQRLVRKEAADGPGFIAVPHRCGSGMRIDVIDVLGFNAGICQSPAHAADSSVQVGIGDMMTVTAHAKAAQFSQDGGPPVQGVGQFFQNQDTGAFGHNETGVPLIKRPAGSFGSIIVTGGQSAHPIKTRHGQGSQGCFGPAGQHHICFSQLNGPEGGPDGLASGGAGTG